MEELKGVYAAKNMDSGVRAASRSGGVFTALSDYILINNGCIYGCVLLDDFTAHHKRASTKEERNKMRGSKYIQSNLGRTFVDVKTDLDSGNLVLFSGTSCQVAGLRKFLRKEYDNLYCVDIVCHGVPSPQIWKSFLDWQYQKYKKEIIAVDFRNKKDFGWAEHTESLYTKDGTVINSKVYGNLFLSDYILRPSCYECKYKSTMHPGDITIADFWGIDNAVPGFNDNKGVSLVLVNSNKGELLFNSILGEMDIVKTNINDALQPALLHPFPRPKNRDVFWSEYRSKDFEYIAKKYGGYEHFPQKIKRHLKKILNKFIKY